MTEGRSAGGTGTFRCCRHHQHCLPTRSASVLRTTVAIRACSWAATVAGARRSFWPYTRPSPGPPAATPLAGCPGGWASTTPPAPSGPRPHEPWRGAAGPSLRLAGAASPAPPGSEPPPLRPAATIPTPRRRRRGRDSARLVDGRRTEQGQDRSERWRSRDPTRRRAQRGLPQGHQQLQRRDVQKRRPLDRAYARCGSPRPASWSAGG